MIELLSILVLLQVADAITTIKGISLGLSEGNPVVAKVFKKLSPVAGIVSVKVIVVSMILLAHYMSLLHLYALIALCVVYGLIVVNNVIRIRKVQQ